MNLTPEQQELGRRNFMRALAGTPALAALGAAAAMKGPVRGGPVRLGYVGLGGQGRVLLEQTDPRYGEVVALCDINPVQLQKADESLVQTGRQPLKHYADWKEMIQKERLEGVVIASPLFTHADLTVGCMEAGLHVLCEKMMAWDEASCRRMVDAARRTGRVLEIGHQRYYNPIYQAAYDGIVKTGLLGEVYHARLVWHRNGNWRRKADLPSPDYAAAPWGYPTFDHLVNWRLYKQYSRGHMAELASHMVAITDWFFGATAEAATGSGGVFRYKDGREVPDHTYVTLEYPGGRTAVFTSIESNAFDHYYEAYYGTRGTLILNGEIEAYLFDEGAPRARRRRRRRGGREGAGAGGRRLREPVGRRGGRRQGRGRRVRRRRPPGGVPVRGRRLLRGDPDRRAAQVRARARPGLGARLHRRLRGDRDEDEDRDQGLRRPPWPSRAVPTAVPDEAGVRVPVPARRHPAGRAPPGQRLVIDEIARRLEVCAIPMREALQLLQSEGLVLGAPHVGATVAPVSQDEVHEVFAIMEALETVAVREAARRLDEAGLARLRTSSPNGRGGRGCRTTSAGRRSTATSTGPSTRSPGCPSCAR